MKASNQSKRETKSGRIRSLMSQLGFTIGAQATAHANTVSEEKQRSSSNISDLFYIEKEGPDLLFLGPTTECICGNNVFHALIWFGEDREIGGWFTEMSCAFCGALLRGATPIDHEVPSD